MTVSLCQPAMRKYSVGMSLHAADHTGCLSVRGRGGGGSEGRSSMYLLNRAKFKIEHLHMGSFFQHQHNCIIMLLHNSVCL